VYLNRADFEPVESEIEIEIDSRVSVEDTQSDTALIGSDHGYCVDVCWLQLRLLNPYWEGWANTVGLEAISFRHLPVLTIDQGYWGD